MRITSRPRNTALAAGLLTVVALLAACGTSGTKTTNATTPTPAASSTTAMGGMNAGSGSMGGMNMADAVPGKGLLTSYAGFTLKPSTTTVAAGKSSPYRFQIVQGNGTALTSYQVEQTKLLHFYLVRSDLTGFEHLHPSLATDGTWSVDVSPPTAGSYRVFTQFIADPKHMATDLVLSQPLTVTGTPSPVAALPAVSATTSVDGYTLAVSGDPKASVASPLTIKVSKDGQPVTDLQQYLDTYAHLTAFHQGDMGFAHLHPSGAVNGDHGGPTLSFDAVLAESGNYRLFIQFQTAGVLHTAQVTLAVM